MIKIKSLILLMFVLFSTLVWSKEDSIFFKDNHGDNYILSYQEEGSWNLDHIIVPKGKLQERVFHKIFETKEELEAFKVSHFKNKLKQKSFQLKSKYVQSESPKIIWKVQNQWNENWEIEFSEWIKKEFNKDFFIKYNLKTDCADVAFALRWIFARMHSLPAANTLAGSHVIFSQDSFKAEWASLKTSTNWFEDELFLAALNYLMEHAYTKTLNIDGYPISISKDTFLVGTIHLDGGHTMIISKIDYQGVDSAPIWKLSSTVPAAVRELYEQMMIDQTITDQSNGGLFRMRWPRKSGSSWELVPKDEMPYYSLEQYEDSFRDVNDHFTLSLFKKIGINFEPEKILKESVIALKNDLEYRKTVVQEGYNACLKLDCSEGTFEYEEYSTPTRDGRILTKFKTVEKLVSTFSELDPDLKDKWKKLSEGSFVEVEGVSKSLIEYKKLLENSFMSSHPEDSVAVRWGVAPTDIAQGIESRLRRKLIIRDKLVQNASICIGSNLCEKGSDNWNNLNTFEFDNKLKENVYGNYYSLCAQYDCTKLFKTLTATEIDTIPYLSSDPNMSLYYRNGEQKEKFKSFPLPKANKIIQLDEDLFLLDDRIYNSYTQAFDTVWKGIESTHFNTVNKVLVGLKNNKVVYKGLKESNISSLSTTFEVEKIFWLTHDYLLARDCANTISTNCNFVLYIYDSKNGLVPVKEASSVFNITHRYTDNFFSETDASSLSYLELNQKTNFYDSVHFVLNESQVFEDRLAGVSIRDTAYLKDYSVLHLMEVNGQYQDSIVYNLNTGSKCISSKYPNSYIDTIREGKLNNFYMAATNDGDSYVYGKLSDHCQFEEFYTTSIFSNVSVNNDVLFMNLDTDKFGVYKNDNFNIIKSKGSGYFGSYYTNEELLWMKMTNNYQVISEVYLENLNTGTTRNLDPKNIRMPCRDDRCVTKNQEIFGDLYYKRDDLYSYNFTSIYIDNILFGTTYSKTANQPDMDMDYSKPILYIESGSLIEINKGTYLYLK